MFSFFACCCCLNPWNIVIVGKSVGFSTGAWVASCSEEAALKLTILSSHQMPTVPRVEDVFPELIKASFWSLATLILWSASSCCHKHWEFICATVLLFPKGKLYFSQFHQPLTFSLFLFLILLWSLRLSKSGCVINALASAKNYTTSYCMRFDKFCISVFIYINWKDNEQGEIQLPMGIMTS